MKNQNKEINLPRKKIKKNSLQNTHKKFYNNETTV